jgi:hypothetical protein
VVTGPAGGNTRNSVAGQEYAVRAHVPRVPDVPQNGVQTVEFRVFEDHSVELVSRWGCRAEVRDPYNLSRQR